MKQNSVPAILVLSLLFITGLQCIKRKVECTGNCSQLQVSGAAINRLTGEAVAGVPFELSWADSHVDIGDLIGLYIYKGSSGSTGAISFTTTIDTTRFPHETLSILMLDNNSYMMDYEHRDSLRLNSYLPGGFQNVVLGVYPQAQLALQLQASSTTSSWKSLGIDYKYDNGRTFTAYYTDFPDKFTPHTVTVPTAAGLVTKLSIRKGKADGTYEYTSDSIVCRQGAANEKTITF